MSNTTSTKKNETVAARAALQAGRPRGCGSIGTDFGTQGTRHLSRWETQTPTAGAGATHRHNAHMENAQRRTGTTQEGGGSIATTTKEAAAEETAPSATPRKWQERGATQMEAKERLWRDGEQRGGVAAEDGGGIGNGSLTQALPFSSFGRGREGMGSFGQVECISSDSFSPSRQNPRLVRGLAAAAVKSSIASGGVSEYRRNIRKTGWILALVVIFSQGETGAIGAPRENQKSRNREDKIRKYGVFGGPY
eukprot:7382706-Prymnesium_polylepis.1